MNDLPWNSYFGNDKEIPEGRREQLSPCFSGGTKMSLGHLYLPQWMRERLGHRQLHVCMCAESLQSCQTRCNPTDCSPPDSSVHGILQARILEWIAILTQGSNSHLLCLLHGQLGSLPLASREAVGLRFRGTSRRSNDWNSVFPLQEGAWF